MRILTTLTMAFALAALLALAGCEKDPCDGKTGTCLAVILNGSVGPLDSASFVLTGACQDSFEASSGQRTSLPLAQTIMMPLLTSAGPVKVNVQGKRDSAVVGIGYGTVTVTPNTHSKLTITLQAGSIGQACNTDLDCMPGSGDDLIGCNNSHICAYKPVVTTVDPPSGPTTGNTPLTITGAHFSCSPLPVVNVGGITITSGVSCTSETTITTTIPAQTTSAPRGFVAVRVTNSDGLYGEKADAYRFYPQTLSFNVSTISLSGSPSELALGDFDAKNGLDIAVSRGTSPGYIDVVLNNGHGIFLSSPSISVAVGANPRGLAAGKFNSDDFCDLAVANENSLTVSILTGHSDGNLVPTSTCDATGVSLIATDFDGDTLLDLAIVDTSQNVIRFYAGAGDATFHDPLGQTLIQLPASTRPIAVANPRLLGHSSAALPDLVSVNNNDSSLVSSFLNYSTIGAWSFAPENTYVGSVDSNPSGVAFGSFTVDGLDDLIVSRTDEGCFINFLKARASGDAFDAARCVASPAGVTAMAAIGVGDFNDDGKLDFVTAGILTPSTPGNAYIFLGNGDGTFQAASSFSVGQVPFALAVGDLNGDGLPDIVVSNYASDSVSVLINTSN